MTHNQQQQQLATLDRMREKLDTPAKIKAFFVAAGITDDEKDERFNTTEKAMAYLTLYGIGADIPKRRFIMPGTEDFIQEQFDKIFDIHKLADTPEKLKAFLAASGVVVTKGVDERFAGVGTIRIMKMDTPTRRARIIEPKILPLVNALNATEILKTFSSCQGHFGWFEQQRYYDRTQADVRFYPRPETTSRQMESFLYFIARECTKENCPVNVDLHQRYMYQDDGPGSIYVIAMRPIDRFAIPWVKRKHTDEAIRIMTEIVLRWIIEAPESLNVPRDKKFIDIYL